MKASCGSEGSQSSMGFLNPLHLIPGREKSAFNFQVGYSISSAFSISSFSTFPAGPQPLPTLVLFSSLGGGSLLSSKVEGMYPPEGMFFDTKPSQD